LTQAARRPAGGVRLAVSNLAWPRSDDEAVAGILQEEGCRGVEVALTKAWPEPLRVPDAEVDRYRRWWEQRELPIVALQALLFGRPDLVLFGPAQVRRELLSYLGRIMEIGARLGAGALVFGSPKNRRRGELVRDEALRVATEFFTEAAGAAERAGVVLAIEPNPPQYGCDFVTTIREAVELCTRVDHPAFRVHADVGGLTLSGEDPRALATGASLLAHSHVSEPHLVEIGTGGADHESAAAAFAAGGYDGWLSIEMREEEGAEERVRRAVRRARAAYQKVLA
jgi:sugar phosphate isomerase/epimerase